MRPLTRADLDAARCATPGCAHDEEGVLWLHGKCHEQEPLYVSYGDGLLLLWCAVCQQQITAIAVAEQWC